MRTRMSAWTLAGVALFCMLTPAATWAQVVYGNIIGTVTDPSGAVIPNATITIVSDSTGISYSTTSNESGNYTEPNLPPGTYTVTVSASGFQTFEQKNVTVTVGNSTPLNAALVVGQVTQKVTVTAAPPLLQTDRASVSTNLTTRQVEQLPILNRNFTQLELLLPGTSQMPWQHAESENPQGGIQINANGQLFSTTNFLMDGMNNNDPVLGIIMVNPTMSSVQEVRVTNSNFDAEFAQAGGSVIQVQTKSGSNEIHGDAFEFLQNDVFQARDPFTQGLHAPGTPDPAHRGVPELRWNQFGGSVGGPIMKNKLFGFFDYQGTRRLQGGSVLTRVPTAAERAGDLSGLGVEIYDPATGNPDGSGRQLFSDPTRATAANPQGLNIIPVNRLTTQATNLLNLLPMPNVPGATGAAPNYAVSQVERFDTNQWDIRVDHYVNDRLRYFGRYDYFGSDINAPGAFGLFGGPQPFPSFEGRSLARNQNGVLSATYDVTTSMLATFRFGATRYRVIVSSLDGDVALADQVGIPGLNLAGKPDTLGLPDLFINGTGGFQMGYQCNCPLHQTENVFDWGTDWTWVKGNHTIKWGGDVQAAQNLRLPSDQHRAGVYNFDPSITATLENGQVEGGVGLASFLLGDATNFGRFAQISTNQQDRQKRMFYFGQDTWRITPKLTLNYGVRWDTWFPDASLHPGQGGRYDVADNLVRIPGVGGISMSADSETQWANISPRLGIAYALNPKTVIRTGWGRSYFQGTFGWTFNNLAADIYPSIVSQSIPQPSPFFPAIDLATAPPLPVFPDIPSNGLLELPNGVSTSYIPVNQHIPYSDSWNFSVQREITPDFTVTASYIGNVGRHLNMGWNLNNAIPGPGSDFNLRRPLFKEFGIEQNIFNKCDCENSNYNALQVVANKRFSEGYSVLGTFSWSKTLDFGEFGTPTDQFNTQLDYGPAVFDRAVTMTLGHIVALPFGKGRHWGSNAGGILNGFIGGWQWTGITSWSSGLPFSPALNNNASLNSDMSLRPDQTGDPMSGITQDRNHWFNPAVFAVPGPFLFGNAGRNSLRGPGFFSANWALHKNLQLTERVGMEIRWESFNLFNNTNLGLPDGAVDSGTAGLITSLALPMRNMQWGVKFGW
ncbi:MAG: TonB-dependent receptor domain-containing protein [Terriglobia bacterium]